MLDFHFNKHYILQNNDQETLFMVIIYISLQPTGHSLNTIQEIISNIQSVSQFVIFRRFAETATGLTGPLQ